MIAAQRLALPAAGENQLTKRETAKVQNSLQKCAESHPPAPALFAGCPALFALAVASPKGAAGFAEVPAV